MEKNPNKTKQSRILVYEEQSSQRECQVSVAEWSILLFVRNLMLMLFYLLKSLRKGLDRYETIWQ